MGLQRFAGPGHWNDPDMLEVGNGKLTADENRLHMSLWCLLAAPLLAGNDLSNMSPEVLQVLTNREVLAIDQDPLGVQGHRVWQEGPIDVWIKPLADGGTAVGLFNKGVSDEEVTVLFRELGVTDKVQVRDLWAKKDLGSFEKSFTSTVPRHGVVLLKIR